MKHGWTGDRPVTVKKIDPLICMLSGRGRRPDYKQSMAGQVIDHGATDIQSCVPGR